MLIRNIELQGLLSFGPRTPSFDLHDLNVLIGPNGSGKSNFIEAIALLRAMPLDFASAIREGGGAAEWLWKGAAGGNGSKIKVETAASVNGQFTPSRQPFRYRCEFAAENARVAILDEAIEAAKSSAERVGPDYYYRFNRGHPTFRTRDWKNPETRVLFH